MKIKELFENNNDLVTVKGYISAMDGYMQGQLDDILENFERGYKKYNIKVTKTAVDEFDYSFQLELSQVQMAHKILDQMFEYINNATDPEDPDGNIAWDTIMELPNLPTSSVDCEGIIVELQVDTIENINLSNLQNPQAIYLQVNINPKIDSLEPLIELLDNNEIRKLTLNFTEFNRPINLLPLFKAKNKDPLSKSSFEMIGKIKPEIRQIFSHWIDNGNVLKCQKELIENGFKDYAK